MVSAKTPFRFNFASNKGRSMGDTRVLIKVQNSHDWAAHQTSKNGKKRKTIRTVLIPDAVVDSGATFLSLPSRYIKQLGLIPFPGKMPAQTTNGYVERSFYGGALLSIGDRYATIDVIESPDDLPALIGCIPLEIMDLLIDPVNQRLVGRNGDRIVILEL
jgi:predicted aspartyl protease